MPLIHFWTHAIYASMIAEMAPTEMSMSAPVYPRAARIKALPPPSRASRAFAARETKIAVSPGEEFDWLPAPLRS